MPPLDTQTQEPDVEQAAQQQDLQDQYERQQAGITPGVTPASFQRTAPGVYTPVPDTAPAPPSALPRTGLPALQIRRPPSYADIQNWTSDEADRPAPPPPKEDGGFTSDLGHYLGGTLQNWGGSALGFGKFLNDATIDSPGLRDKLDSWTAGFAKGGEDQFAKMSPSAQNAARADILRTFNIGPDTDEQGNHIPSPFEAGIGTYLAQRLAPIIAPAAALYFLPEGAVAVTAEIATALLFGSMTAGEGYNKVSDLVNKLPDAELRKESEPYEAFRAGGMPVDEAKGKLKVSTWSSVLATFAAGTAAGFGFGKVLRPGPSTGFLASRAIGAGEGAATFGLQSAASNAGGQLGMMQTGIQKDFDTEALARETAAGVVGGSLFGIAAARRAPKPEEAPPPHPDVDPANQEALAAAGISNEPPDGGGGGGASTAPPPSGAPPPPSTAPDMSGVPGYSPPPVPQRVFPTESLTRPYTPPESEATGIPGYSPPPPDTPPPPPPGGSARPPAAQAAVDASVNAGRARPRAPRGDVPPGVPVEVAPTGEARVVGAPAPAGPLPSGTMTKTALSDALTGMGIEHQGDEPRRHGAPVRPRAGTTPSTQTPPDTTVTEGPPTAPARETAPGPVAETQAAPPVSGALTPPAPEGVRETPPTTEPTAEISTGVRPEGGPASVTDERPTQATAEVTPGVTEQQQPVSKRAAQKAKMAGGVQVEQAKGHVETPTEGERETAASRQQRLATADQTREQARSQAVTRVRDLLEEATRNVIPLKKGSMEVTPAIQGALRDLVESVGKTDGTMEMVTKAVADWARAHPGRIPGTQTSWLAIGDHIHKGMHPEGKGLPEREAFAKGAAAQVEAQPRAVESETQKRQAEVEEAATTKEQDVAREEGAPAGETSAGMTAETATSEKKIAKGTSADVRGRQWIEKAIDPNDETTALQADAAFGGQNQGKGKKRAEGNKDLATIARRMIDEANKKLDSIVGDIRKAQENKLLTSKEREVRTKRLMDELNATDPDRVARLEQVVRELTDEVGVAADARKNLLNRIAKSKGEAPKQLESSAGVIHPEPHPDSVGRQRWVTGKIMSFAEAIKPLTGGPFKLLAERLTNLIADKEVHFRSPEDLPRVYGHYSIPSDRINIRGTLSNGYTIQTLLHEGVHAATHFVMHANEKIYQRATGLLGQLKIAAARDGTPGIVARALKNRRDAGSWTD